MRTIGIRELQQHARRHLRDVEAGETIEIVPGQRGDLLAVAPVEPTPGVPLPSQILEDMRRDER
jgi:antitoxin (DNA-binding transcriptional repressor) of toxin-antitoxin stability system